MLNNYSSKFAEWTADAPAFGAAAIRAARLEPFSFAYRGLGFGETASALADPALNCPTVCNLLKLLYNRAVRAVHAQDSFPLRGEELQRAQQLLVVALRQLLAQRMARSANFAAQPARFPHLLRLRDS